jgi:hypothetical protein
VAANSASRENHLQVYGPSLVLFKAIGIDMQIVLGVNNTSPESQLRRPASSRPKQARHKDDSFRAEFYLIGRFQAELDFPRP